MKILLHSCCAGCAAFIIKKLQKHTKITVFFYNPNIYPKKEYNIRMNEVKKYCDKLGVEFVEQNADYDDWKSLIQGHEKDPEKGKRCQICIKHRLEQAAKFAQKNGFTHFATTLTISPHKDAEFVNSVGSELAEKYGLQFIDEVWRKNDGFLHSCKLSKELGFYRQEYCGCEYSVRSKAKS